MLCGSLGPLTSASRTDRMEGPDLELTLALIESSLPAAAPSQSSTAQAGEPIDRLAFILGEKMIPVFKLAREFFGSKDNTSSYSQQSYCSAWNHNRLQLKNPKPYTMQDTMIIMTHTYS
eukprot:417438-Amphidinium_carterae.1